MSRSLESHTLKNTAELTANVHQLYGLAVARAQLKCWRKLILMRDRARDGEGGAKLAQLVDSALNRYLQRPPKPNWLATASVHGDRNDRHR